MTPGAHDTKQDINADSPSRAAPYPTEVGTAIITPETRPPNTVGKAIEEIAQFNVLMTTIHLQGGMEMITAANQAKGRIKILGVTLLTSLDEGDTQMLYSNSFDNQFNNLINVAEKSEVDGIVCSSKELNLLSSSNLIKVVPGIRNQNLSDDQKRVMSSKEAYENGANYIVVGRPITQSKNIDEAIREYS